MAVVSARTTRDLRALGAHIANARRTQDMTSALLAARAGISRQTLSRIEAGDGSPRIDSVLSVLRVLGLAEAVVAAADPLTTEFGRANADRAARRRVRAPRRAPTALAS
jgi:DNA-binding XRE family transcriptional regulator